MPCMRWGGSIGGICDSRLGKARGREVRQYFRAGPKCDRLVRALGTAFEVTFATDERLHNAEFNVFFLKPRREVSEAFGLNYEILAGYSPFPKAQPRLAQV